jgi:hypothetical protein
MCVSVIVTLMFLFLIHLVKYFDNKSKDKSSLASMFLLQTMQPGRQGRFDKIGYGQRLVYGFLEYERERWGGPESNMGGCPGAQRIDQSGGTKNERCRGKLMEVLMMGNLLPIEWILYEAPIRSKALWH